ncbi:DUF3379 family protein [Marinicella sediminis]|uniref:DUF3379 family protein n=1 Tax=Marinicella sediminis TaxID=1792834 RepID=A0ABV7JCX4_9GAMM|nr:DUF3379 family protein [Marinicella sediminis]
MMNYFEFKKILDADPYSQNPDFLAAKNSDLRCRKAYQQAMEQEAVINQALKIPVPEHNIEQIRFRQSEHRQRQFRTRLLAMAASVTMVFGASLFYLSNDRSSELEQFIQDALLMEPAVYMSDQQIPQAELAPLFASINTALDGDLGEVHFMKLCPTLNGKGARMVVMNELNQPITVLYMPNSPVEEAINMEMAGFKGKIVALEQGSAAIIARPHENTAQIEASLTNSLKPLIN